MKEDIPTRLLIVDTETTGLDPKVDKCIEIGGILFDIPNRAVLSQISFLLPAEINQAEKINKIPSLITNLDQPWEEGLKYFNYLLDSAELIIAHNASFDQKWFGIDPLPLINKPWLCTMEDISWPDLRPRPSVRDLALAYGVPVWSAHRALTDCIYISEVFSRCENLEELILDGLEPRRLVRALISYEDRNLAKKAGFRWNIPVVGAWTRKLSSKQISELPFEVAYIED